MTTAMMEGRTYWSPTLMKELPGIADDADAGEAGEEPGEAVEQAADTADRKADQHGGAFVAA